MGPLAQARTLLATVLAYGSGLLVGRDAAFTMTGQLGARRADGVFGEAAEIAQRGPGLVLDHAVDGGHFRSPLSSRS